MEAYLGNIRRGAGTQFTIFPMNIIIREKYDPDIPSINDIALLRTGPITFTSIK